MLASAPVSVGQALQAPPLGAAASYALFTSVGALTNTGGTTVVRGGIGTDAGTVTGFTAGTYSGALEVNNVATQDAAKGVAGAYTFLDEDVPMGTAHGTTLGNETLAPGVYQLGAASTLTGELVLNGQNDPNALFIFKIDGALSTDALSRVRLTNAAAWTNVYWYVTGAVGLGANAGFQGTIVANGAITLLAGAVLQGRALTRAGDINLNGNTVTSAATPLPMELTAFTAERRGGNALLRWATASERANAYFAVQSSPDGATFTTIGKVAGHGSTAFAHAYTWTDTHLNYYSAGTIYYRLTQVDIDSSRHYSPIRVLTTAPAADADGLQVYAYPSPSQSPCSLRIEARQAGPITLRLTDARGQLVAERRHELAAGSNSLPLAEAATLAPGVYLVQVQQGAVRQTIRLVRE